MTKHQQNITLWGSSISPYVRKVMVALAEKNLPYTHNEILPTVLLQATGQEIPQAFTDASPLGKIPAIEIDGLQIADSAVIISYLEKNFATGTPLHPIDSTEFANALWFERYADTALTVVSYQKIFFEGIVKPNV